MPDLILHHYPNSPFAEKVRTMFGHKKLPWRSVIIPVIMPKPDVIALTGGYRRTPILQIGADIYCDSALIADVLERLAPSPTLYPAAQAGLAQTFAQWADSTLFWTAIAYAFQPAGIAARFANMPPEAVKAFSADRTAMRANAPRMSVAESTAQLLVFLQRMEAMLGRGHPWLLGAEISIADFSAYHPLWFVRGNEAVAGIFKGLPKLTAWLERMGAIGHCVYEKMSSADALETARSSQPLGLGDAAFTDFHDVALGDQVVILPTDYALDPVEGELALSTATELAVRRSDERTGEVVVHFPRLGFQLKKI